VRLAGFRILVSDPMAGWLATLCSQNTNSAAAVAIYKCTTFPPLLTNSLFDYTWALGDVYLWTK
jgi:hypothetical protein